MKSIIEFLKKDWVVKLIMLAIAILLWLYVSANQVRTDTFPGAIKINTKNVPGSTVATLSEDYAELVLSADKNVWENIKPDSIDVYVDLSGLNIGTHEVQVQAITKNNDVKIVSVKPKKIFVSIEPIINRELPISVIINGDPKDGYIVGNFSVNPETVTISGAKSVIADIDQITASINLSGESESFQKEIDLQVKNISENVILTPTKVTVNIEIVTSGQNKTAGIKPTIIGSPQEGYYISSISVDPATINISGATDSLKTITNISTENISVDGLKNDATVTAKLSFTDGITSSVTEVKVKISIDKISTP